jgi:hypothetical protein
MRNVSEMKAISAEIKVTFEVPEGTPDHESEWTTGMIRPKSITVSAQPDSVHVQGWADTASRGKGIVIHGDVRYVKVKKDGSDSAVSGSYTIWGNDFQDAPEYIRRAGEAVMDIYRRTFPDWAQEGSIDV